MQLRIGVDLLGGNCSPEILFEAVEKTIKSHPSAILVVFVTEAARLSILERYPCFNLSNHPRLEFQVVNEVIEMHDDPLTAHRQKKNSSMLIGLKLLKKQLLDAFVSCGNTGALIAGATLFLPRLPGVKRPSLLASLPTKKKDVAIIDVGGHVHGKADYLVQCAKLGVAYVQCCQTETNPRVGLLNIGIESKKGTSEIRQAYQKLEALHDEKKLCFIGNIESNSIFHGDVDVLVADGFTGNIFLKAIEGISFFLMQKIQKNLQKILPDTSKEIYQQLGQLCDYDEYSGAIVCGVQRVLIKCHGHASPMALFYGIKRALDLLQNSCVAKLTQRFNSQE